MSEDDERDERDRSPGYVLLKQLEGGLVVEVVEEKLHEVGGIKSMEIKLKISEHDVETASPGLIFMLATLSFSDALPAGYSKKQFGFKDEYTVTDFLQHLSFRHGRLYWSTDYVKGRLMKTTVQVDKDGFVYLRALNRDELPRRWVEMLMKLKVDDEDVDDVDNVDDEDEHDSVDVDDEDEHDSVDDDNGNPNGL